MVRYPRQHGSHQKRGLSNVFAPESDRQQWLPTFQLSNLKRGTVMMARPIHGRDGARKGDVNKLQVESHGDQMRISVVLIDLTPMARQQHGTRTPGQDATELSQCNTPVHRRPEVQLPNFSAVRISSGLEA